MNLTGRAKLLIVRPTISSWFNLNDAFHIIVFASYANVFHFRPPAPCGGMRKPIVVYRMPVITAVLLSIEPTT